MKEMLIPIVEEIPYTDPPTFFSRFSSEMGAIFLDSAEQRSGCGRYSFIAIRPFQTLWSKNGLIHLNQDRCMGNPFDVLRHELKKFQIDTLPGLPPFQGGVAGYFGYELCQHLEALPLAKKDDLHVPDLMLGFYDLVVGFDTLTQKAWVFSSGHPMIGNNRLAYAQKKMNALLKEIANPLTLAEPLHARYIKDHIHSNFTRDAYLDAVQTVKNHILSGDIFEANIAQRFCATLTDNASPYALYKQLRRINPAPFAAYLHFPNVTLASTSPERFLSLYAGQIEARPIKGTMPRGQTPEEDKALACALSASEKDHAENVMIVDLLRNDLSRVAAHHSVHVPSLCSLESYQTVHHLVSVVTGQLCQHASAIDLLKAAFPGGSITGAPKIRAMEIIASIEPTQRGPYCGSIGWLGFDGNMDLSITIRTFCIANNTVTFHAGGAIVLDSCPEQEYRETEIKAHALACALTGGGNHDSFN